MTPAPPPRRSPLAQRVKPAAALGIGLLMLAFNAFMVVVGGHFVVSLLFVGCAITTIAGFGVAVGEPEDAYGYRPMWFKVGLVASAIVGLLIALMLHLELVYG